MPRLRLEGQTLRIGGQGGRQAGQQADDHQQVDAEEDRVADLAGGDEHDQRGQQEGGAHQQKDGPGLQRLGHAVVVESASPEECVLAVHPAAAHDAVTGRVEHALVRDPFGAIEQFERAQADLHPRELARLLDRIGVGKHPDRMGVDIGAVTQGVRRDVGRPQPDADQPPIDRDP